MLDNDTFVWIAERIADEVVITETDDGLTISFGDLPIRPVEGVDGLFFV